MKKFITSVIFACMLVLPSVSSAYVSTSQTAVRLSDDVLLFLVSYEFGHSSVSYKMPIFATRGAEGVGVVGYDILKDGKLRTDIGETTSVVLSNATIEGGKYIVPVNESRKFTLVTFLDLPEDRSASSTDFALQVSSLPFEIGGKDNTYRANKLNESELADYKTAVIGTNQKIGITTH